MLTNKQIDEEATRTIANHGMHLVRELKKGENYDGGNLHALLELFATRLEAVDSPDIVGVIDARMGIGWTRKLAEQLARVEV